MRVRLTIGRPQTCGSEGSGRRPSPVSLACSCLLHGLFIGWAVLGPPLPSITPAEPSLYEQVIAPQEKKLIWYHLRDLPRIDPERRVGDSPVPQGRETRNEVII